MKRVFDERPALRKMLFPSRSERWNHKRRPALGVISKKVEHTFVGYVGNAPSGGIHALFKVNSLCEHLTGCFRFKGAEKLLKRHRII